MTQWLRALARLAHEECGGPGVGAIGMCFTGNFALSMMLEPAMLAPVVCQPALPMDDPAGMAMAPAELAYVRERLEREDLTVMAYRFEGDKHCKAQRFAAFSEALGQRFVARVLPDSAANPTTPPFFDIVPQGDGPPLLPLSAMVAFPAKPSPTFNPAQYFNSGLIGSFTPAGFSWALTFDTPGTFEYVCLFHEPLGMKGTVTVLPR